MLTQPPSDFPQARSKLGFLAGNTLLRVVGWLAILCPLLFFFLAVQHSAIVFPFWDHCELIKYFAKLHDRTLQVHELWASHNHSRPLTVRLILLLNGLLTNWDIASEYVYLEASLVLGFLLQAFCLRKLCGAWSLRCVALVALLSIVSFSPAGHNNHWWSFMLVLDLAHVLIISAFITICSAPRAWKNNLLAAVACWLATYTLTNGLVAFLTVAFVVHIAKRPWKHFDKLSVFWVFNIAVVNVLYLPGLGESATGWPGILKLTEFCLAYLGSPVASLLSFPYRDMFAVPGQTLRNALCGLTLLLAAIPVAWSLKRKLANASYSALLFVCFAVFALGSALLTALGRAAFDAVGVANANASRYTLFGSYLVYAFLYALADLRSVDIPSWLTNLRKTAIFKACAILLAVALLSLAIGSYAKSVAIYNQAHDFNQQLAAAFWGDDPANLKYVYPDTATAKLMLADLKRLRIGPYRFVHTDKSDSIVVLANNKVLDQFGFNGLRDLPGLGRILFSNPASSFQMPVTPAVRDIDFSFGILDNAITATPTLAGVEFRVSLQKPDGVMQLLWSRKLQPVSEPGDRGPQSAAVKVASPGDGELIFETKAVGDPQGCWSYWQNVVVQN